jgi:hypothetical protein
MSSHVRLRDFVPPHPRSASSRPSDNRRPRPRSPRRHRPQSPDQPTARWQRHGRRPTRSAAIAVRPARCRWRPGRTCSGGGEASSAWPERLEERPGARNVGISGHIVRMQQRQRATCSRARDQKSRIARQPVKEHEAGRRTYRQVSGTAFALRCRRIDPKAIPTRAPPKCGLGVLFFEASHLRADVASLSSGTTYPPTQAWNACAAPDSSRFHSVLLQYARGCAHTIARQHGVGSGTVQRIRKEMIEISRR